MHDEGSSYMRYPAKLAVAVVAAALTAATNVAPALADVSTPFEPDPKMSAEVPDESDKSEGTKRVVVRAVDMYRLYNQYTGEHFYTSSAGERDDLVAVGWTDEGVGWIAPESKTVPVYRLYNPYVDGGDHHYTRSASEALELVAADWSYEGIGWYSDEYESVPIYREYNPNAVTGTHNYTSSKEEHDSLVKLGWKDEGIGWYGVELESAV